MDRNNKLVYICSPYRGDVKRNKEYARELTRLALDNGLLPITVHLYITEATDDNVPEDRELGMKAGIEILDQCRYILIGGKYGISQGMAGEIQRALETGKEFLTPGEGCMVSTERNMTVIRKYYETYRMAQGYGK